MSNMTPLEEYKTNINWFIGHVARQSPRGDGSGWTAAPKIEQVFSLWLFHGHEDGSENPDGIPVLKMVHIYGPKGSSKEEFDREIGRYHGLWHKINLPFLPPLTPSEIIEDVQTDVCPE